MAEPDTNSVLDISVSHGHTIAFSAYGLLLKQRETVTITEYRAQDEGSAKTLAASLFSDNVTDITLYHATSGGGFVMASVMTGTLVTAVAHRVNEAGFWHVTKTTTVYTWTTPEGTAGGWSTTRPAAGSGFVSDIARSRRVLTEIQGYQLIATESSTTTEWRGCTASEAAALVSGCPSDSMTDRTYRCVRISTELGRHTAPSGTRYTMSAKYISDGEGWSVTRTATTIAISGTNWSL